MRPRVALLFVPAALALAVSCGKQVTTSASSSRGAGGGATTATSGATTVGATSSTSASGTGGAPNIDKSAGCATAFGAALTSAFGRIDGTVLAIVKPVDQQCTMPNSTHVVIEVTMNGAVYRMVVDVHSTGTTPDVWYTTVPHALPGPAWSEGWHTGIPLDYVNDLGVHSAQFTEMMPDPLANTVTDAITIGQKISIFATSSGGSSAHLVHRNGVNNDGAIVIDPDGASPTMLLFRFVEQSF